MILRALTQAVRVMKVFKRTRFQVFLRTQLLTKLKSIPPLNLRRPLLQILTLTSINQKVVMGTSSVITQEPKLDLLSPTFNFTMKIKCLMSRNAEKSEKTRRT